jgi:hypothetical protein
MKRGGDGFSKNQDFFWGMERVLPSAPVIIDATPPLS